MPAQVAFEAEPTGRTLEGEQLPAALWLHDLATDEMARRRTDELLQAVGAVAVEATVRAESAERGSLYPTLLSALRAAADGDLEARRVAEANTLQDLVERSIKAGMVMKPELSVAQQHILQHGQSMEDIFKNSLQYAANSPQMQERTEIETYNGFAIEEALELLRQGYCVVTFSCAPDNMPEAAAAEVGFFVDTMTCAIQVIAMEQDTGRLFEESAFVAGRPHKHAARHDLQAVHAVAQGLGFSLDGLSASGILQRPLLVRRAEFLPNGVIDLVRRYDHAVGEDFFFGQPSQRDDYAAFWVECQEREAAYLPVAQKIVDQLIAEAYRLPTPVAATDRLSQLSQQSLVDRAFTDLSIDPAVFGDEAAHYILTGRELLKDHQYDAFLEVRGHAQRTARSSSCPAAYGSNTEFDADDQDQKGDKESDDEEDEECEFSSRHCPVCGDANARTRVTKTAIMHLIEEKGKTKVKCAVARPKRR